MTFAVAGFLLPISAIIIESIIGNPSSTSALGIFAAPFSALFGAAAGLTVGTVYWTLGRVSKLSFFHPTWDHYTRALWRIVLFIVIILPVGGQLLWNLHTRPRVIVNTNALSPSALSDIQKEVALMKTSGDLVEYGDGPWRFDSQYEVSFDSHTLTITRLDTGQEILHSYRSYDYIRAIQCRLITDSKNKTEYLLVFMRLRSTSRRTMIAIFDSAGSCVYRELEKR